MEKRQAVWITGASSGIGKALCNDFISHGKTVIATSRRIDLLNSIKETFGVNNNLYMTAQLDITNKKDVKEFYSIFSNKFEIEALINNAGITSFKRAIDDSIEEIENILETNLLGSIYTIKTILPDMIQRKSGKIINVLSVVAKKIYLNSSAYSASKTGLLAYTNVLREELRNSNVRVINILPGATITNIWSEKIIEKYSDQMMNAQNVARMIYDLYEMDSNMVPEEIVLKPILGDL